MCSAMVANRTKTVVLYQFYFHEILLHAMYRTFSFLKTDLPSFKTYKAKSVNWYREKNWLRVLSVTAQSELTEVESFKCW